MADAGLSLDNIFKLLEIVSILGGGGLVAFRLGRASQSVKESTERFETGMAAQAKQIEGVQNEIRTLNKLVTEVAVQNQRLDTQDSRLDAHDRLIEDLRRGEGFILPLAPHLQRLAPK